MRKNHLFIFLLILLFSIALALRYWMYVDTGQHRKFVESLPVFSKQADKGAYRLIAREYEFLVRLAGMQHRGPAVILLHGFPESSAMWEPLMEKLAQAGYRVLALDQRGYSPGARPKVISAYHYSELLADVWAIAHQAGFEKFHLVGHDWGAAVGWAMSMAHPERILSWSALSIPHLGIFCDGMINDPEQKKRSAYMNFFKTAGIPENNLLGNGQAGLKQILAELPAEQKEQNLRLFVEPGALTAALNWYRALDVEGLVKNKTFERSVKVPTLFIWGNQDPVIAATVIARQKKWIEAPYRELSLESGHFLIQQQAQAVIEAIAAHIQTTEKGLK